MIPKVFVCGGAGARAWPGAEAVPCVPQMDALNSKDGANRWVVPFKDKTNRERLISQIHHHVSETGEASSIFVQLRE